MKKLLMIIALMCVNVGGYAQSQSSPLERMREKFRVATTILVEAESHVQPICDLSRRANDGSINDRQQREFELRKSELSRLAERVVTTLQALRPDFVQALMADRDPNKVAREFNDTEEAITSRMVKALNGARVCFSERSL